jgi:hypothetical protein
MDLLKAIFLGKGALRDAFYAVSTIAAATTVAAPIALFSASYISGRPINDFVVCNIRETVEGCDPEVLDQGPSITISRP